MAGCAFELLFSPAVVNIRNENIHCSCLKVAQLCSNTPIVDFGISGLLEVACLSFEDVLHVSECSHRGLSIGMQRGRRMLDFLRIRSASGETRWQRKKARIMAEHEQDRTRAEEDVGETAHYLGENVGESGTGKKLAGSDVMKKRQIFWAKLRFQIQKRLSGLHTFSLDASLRRLTIHGLLRDIGILDGHKHLSSSASALLQLVIPERRYWEHWLNHWKFTEEPSEHNVVLGILAFTLYIARVCHTCNEALESQGYRIHSEFGVQRRKTLEGNVTWLPDYDYVAAEVKSTIHKSIASD